MIEITQKDFFGKGLARACYYHPENENLCIKIGHPHIELHRLQKEIKYLQKLNRKNKSKYSYMFYSSYQGEIETTLGNGFVFDLIRDEHSGKISLTLEDYLNMEKLPFSREKLISAVKELKTQMLKNKVFAKDLRARNICCRILKDGTLRMIIIDGIGHRDFFPFVEWFHYYANKKVEKNFRKDGINILINS